MEVCGEAENPYEAREQVLQLDPDVLCLDIIMPRMDGLTFLRKIMQYKPIPTVIVSTIAKQGSAMRRKVLDAGAVDVVDKEELNFISRSRRNVTYALTKTSNCRLNCGSPTASLKQTGFTMSDAIEKAVNELAQQVVFLDTQDWQSMFAVQEQCTALAQLFAAEEQPAHQEIAFNINQLIDDIIQEKTSDVDTQVEAINARLLPYNNSLLKAKS